VMEEFNIHGKQTSFYKYCPGTFGYTLALSTLKKNLGTWCFLKKVYFLNVLRPFVLDFNPIHFTYICRVFLHGC